MVVIFNSIDVYIAFNFEKCDYLCCRWNRNSDRIGHYGSIVHQHDVQYWSAVRRWAITNCSTCSRHIVRSHCRAHRFHLVALHRRSCELLISLSSTYTFNIIRNYEPPSGTIQSESPTASYSPQYSIVFRCRFQFLSTGNTQHHFTRDDRGWRELW